VQTPVYPIFSYFPTTTGFLASALNFADVNALDAENGPAVPSTNYLGLWTGTLTVGGAGTWSFGTNSDDGSIILIDLNNDGIFSAAERIVNNNGFHGAVTVTGNATFYGSLWTNDLNLRVGGSAVAKYSSAALSLANAVGGGGALPAPLQVTSLVDCAQLPAATGGCP